MTWFYELREHHPHLRARYIAVALLMSVAAVILGYVTMKQPLLALSVELAALLALAILAKPNIATMAVLFILYTNAPVVAVRFHNVPDFIASALPALLVFPLASSMIFRRQKLIINPILPLIFLFLVVQVVGTLFADRVPTAVANVQVFLIEGIGLFFLVTNIVRTQEMLRRVTWTLLIAGAVIGALSFYQQVTRSYDTNFWGFAQLSEAAFNTGQEGIEGKITQWRLTGPIGEQNRYAQIMLMLVPLGMFRFWGEKRVLARILAGIATGFVALGAAMAFSRGAAVGFALMLVIMAFMRYIRAYQIIIMVIGIYLLMAAVPEYRTRLLSIEGTLGLFSEDGASLGSADGATLSRLTEMGAAALVFIDHPLIGVGPGLFPYYYKDYAEIVGLRVLASDRQAHNLYLGLAAETGALGFACMMGILFLTLHNLARVRRRWLKDRPELANMATAYMLAIVTYMTTGFFLHFAFIRYFWLILALACTASYLADQQARKEDRQPEESTALVVRPANDTALAQ